MSPQYLPLEDWVKARFPRGEPTRRQILKLFKDGRLAYVKIGREYYIELRAEIKDTDVELHKSVGLSLSP